MLRQPPAIHGVERSRWRLQDLPKARPWLAGYTQAGLSKALQRLRVGRKRGRLCVHRPDLAYETKLARIARAVQLAHAKPEEVRLLYADEFSLYRQPTLAAVYAEAGVEPKARLSHRSNIRHRFSGALDLAQGQVTWTAGAKMGVDGLKAFLRTLRKTYPTQTLFLVWDNWPVHAHAGVLTTASELGIQLLWLPTYAPWTNPIEKLWRWLKQDLLHHHRLADQWNDLKAKVATFLDRFKAGSTDLLQYVGLLPD